MIHTVDNPIIMTSTIKVENIIKKTTAKGWKNVNVDDILYISTTINPNNGASNGLYQTYLKIENKNNNEVFYNSINEFCRYTSCNVKVTQIN